MAIYRFARAGEEAELLDFINFVFSFAHRPHDFKRLVPGVYDRPGFAPLHAVAEENGRIRAAAGLLPGQLRLAAGLSLTTGYIGSVSAHPYARGEGHMKKLMAMLEDRAREENIDLLMLGGRRQRYNYFGYERGGTALRFRISPDNVRHALKEINTGSIRFLPMDEASEPEIDEAYAQFRKLSMVGERDRAVFPAILRTWENKPHVVFDNGNVLGYLTATPDGDLAEWALPDGALFPVIKAWHEAKGGNGFSVTVSQHQTGIITLLAAIAEGYELTDSAMLRPLNWKNVLSAALRFKCGWFPMQDGSVVIDVAGEGRWRLSVTGGTADVQDTQEAADVTLSGNRAVHLFFSPISALRVEAARFGNWLPLALTLPEPDCF